MLIEICRCVSECGSLVFVQPLGGRAANVLAFFFSFNLLPVTTKKTKQTRNTRPLAALPPSGHTKSMFPGMWKDKCCVFVCVPRQLGTGLSGCKKERHERHDMES